MGSDYMWTSKWTFEWRDFVLNVWRSDNGFWGYSSQYYDGHWRAFGLGKLGGLSWGPRCR